MYNMALLGWIPLHGSGTAIPVIDRTDNPFDILSLDELVQLSPYVTREQPDWLTGTYRFAFADPDKLFRYTIKYTDGSIAGGISDVYLMQEGSSIRATIFGAQYTSLNRWHSIANKNYTMDGQFVKRYAYMSYGILNGDPFVTLLTTTAQGESEITFDSSARFLKNGAGASLSSFEIYDNRSDAIDKAGGSPYNPGGNSTPAGGGGSFGDDRVSDDIRPYIPNGSAENDVSNCGLFTRYLVNNAQLRQFSEDVFSTGLIDVLIKELVEITYGKVYDAIISLVSYPFALASLSGVTTTAGNIYLGRHNTGAPSSGILTNGFGQIDWGTIEINEFWGNFLDYAPHTKIQLYLPWGTGFVDIDPNEVMNGTIQVLTNVELSKGNCVHMVLTGSGSVIGVYNGFCGSQYPITSVDTSGKVIATATAAVALATAGASGVARNMGALEEGMRQARELEGSGLGNFADAMREATQRQFIQRASYNALHSRPAKIGALSSVAAARISPTYPRNGSFSPSASSLSPQVPYIIMTWPDQSVPAQYGSHVGYPSNIFSNLGRLRGYTEIGAIHLDGINCTEHEREELMSILQGGVIL